MLTFSTLVLAISAIGTFASPPTTRILPIPDYQEAPREAEAVVTVYVTQEEPQETEYSLPEITQTIIPTIATSEYQIPVETEVVYPVYPGRPRRPEGDRPRRPEGYPRRPMPIPDEDGSYIVEVEPTDKSIAGYLKDESDYSTLYSLLELTGLSSLFEEEDAVLFAPDNSAFENLPSFITEKFNQELTGREVNATLFTITSLLLYHTHLPTEERPSAYLQTTPEDKQYFALPSTLGSNAGPNITVYQSDDQWYVNDAQVNLPIIDAENGYIVPISKVITPLYLLEKSVYDLKEFDELPGNYTFPNIDLDAVQEEFRAGEAYPEGPGPMLAPRDYLAAQLNL